MNRNIFAFLLLFAVFTQVMHIELGYHYLIAYIAFAPIAMVIFMYTIVPVMLLQKGKIVNQNYEVANALIVVAVVESALLLLTTYVFVNINYYYLIKQTIIELIILITIMNGLAFFGEYDQKWPYIISGLSILVLVFGYWIAVNNHHPFFVDLTVFYMSIHLIFLFSFVILRRIIVYRFPPRSSYTMH